MDGGGQGGELQEAFMERIQSKTSISYFYRSSHVQGFEKQSLVSLDFLTTPSYPTVPDRFPSCIPLIYHHTTNMLSIEFILSIFVDAAPISC